VFCTDITGGVYASVSSSDRVRSGMSVTHGGGLAHSEASMYERDGSGWFDSILEEEDDDGNEDDGNEDDDDDDDEEDFMFCAISILNRERKDWN
jgi:hypothetical protein